MNLLFRTGYIASLLPIEKNSKHAKAILKISKILLSGNSCPLRKKI
jgi:hypothetical protein